MKRLISVLVIFLYGITNIYAQNETLNLSKCLSIAIKNNLTLSKLRNSVESSNSTITSKYGVLFPSLSFNSGWTRSNQVTNGSFDVYGIPTNVGTTNTTSNNFSMGLRSDVTLFNGFTNYENIDLAKMNRQSYYLQIEKTKDDIALKVISDYISVLKNQQILIINQARLVDSKQQLDNIKIFVEVGKKTISDVYKQDVLVAQNELLVEQSKNNVDKSISDLVSDLNYPLDKSYIVKDDEFSLNITSNDIQRYILQNSNLNTLVNNAVKNRQDYKVYQQTVKINEANYELTRNSLIFPTLSGFASYNLSGSKIGEINNSRVFTLGLSLSYPIFQGFQLSTQKEIAELTVKSSIDDLELLKNQYSLDIRKAVLDVKSLAKQIEISDRTIKSSEQDKYFAEESYKIGLATLLDVQTATTTYNNALIDKSNLIYNYILLQKQLEYYQGLLNY